jgi:hypothetical protein
MRHPKSQKNISDKLMTEDTQAFARVISKEGESASLLISHASITKNGVTKTLLNDDIEISTNKVPGDITKDSTALLTLPIDQNKKSTIHTFGNASVNNKGEYFDLEIKNNVRALSIKSSSDLFAIIRISEQRDQNFKFFSILFGVAGKKENINEQGRKNRSDVAIFSNGNGKFIRLSDTNGDFNPNWTIENTMIYDPIDKNIYPSRLVISSIDHSEKLILSFNFHTETKKVILEDGSFELTDS